MSSFLQDLRFGVRTLRKTPGFTAVAVAVLALGIGANSAMFTIVNALLFKPLAGRADELVGVYSHDRTKPDSYRAFSYPEYLDIRDGSNVFDGLLAHNFAMVGVPEGDATRQTFADVVSSNFFDAVGVHLAAGRTFTREEERPGAHIPVAIVAYDHASLLGQTTKINTIDFTVVGVVPRGFTGTMALVSPEVWLPLGMHDVVVNDVFKRKATGLDDRTNHSLVLAGRLRDEVSAQSATARLDALSHQLEAAYPAENRNQLLTISPLPRSSTSTSPQTDSGIDVAGALLMALATVVLLIACLNIANMLLARGVARRKEIAIRLAVGGARRRLIRQLLTEGLLLAGAGAAGGLVLAFWTTRALVQSLQNVMPISVQFDPKPDAVVTAVTTAFAFGATLLFGLGPALKLSRTDVVTDLKEAGNDGGVLGKRFSARNVMVVGQIALSLMLLASGGLFARGALKAAAANPGFSYSQELLVTIDPSLVQYTEPRGRESHRSALARIRALPGIASASLASSVPFGDFHEGRPVERLGGGAERPVEAVLRIVGSEYFRTLNLPMLRGREFTADEEESPQAPRVVVIDERLARRLFGDEDPLGQSIRFQDGEELQAQFDTQPMQVVGIAPPIRDELFDREAGPAIYLPSGRAYRAMTNIHVRLAQPGTDATALASIRQALRSLDPRLPVISATTMAAFHDRSIELWAVRAGGRLFLLFGVLALALAVVGLYGVKSYVVSQRTREIGVRMALGADRTDVLRMMLKEGAVLAGVGIAIGLPLAAGLGRLLSSMLYDVKPLDPIVFASAPALLALAALLATWIPARRATKVSPLSALRS
ncbi:MAG TPA: ABC transporter permease [Vicinamibacterales bacterium]|jgi:predicted permease|nr:ABC transporter permease [Vicinamibacterales bacterium]